MWAVRKHANDQAYFWPFSVSSNEFKFGAHRFALLFFPVLKRRGPVDAAGARNIKVDLRSVQKFTDATANALAATPRKCISAPSRSTT